MSMMLRVEMIIIALIFVAGVVRAVNRKKIRLQYSLIWLIISIGVMVLAFFPGIIIDAAKFMKIETPTNLLYLLAILCLLAICFYLTTIVSQQSDKIQRFIQITSVERYLKEEERENHNGSKEDE